MFEKITLVIKKYNMLKASETVIIGLSGGADSVVLLHILKRVAKDLSLNLIAAHLNHMLRGSNAEKDEEFVALTCKEWGVPLFTKKADVRAMAEKWRMSQEEAGRKARYDFFQELMTVVNADKLALAHHRDDKVETILHNIVRGTGTHGLKGIAYVRDGFVIRPLLDVSKEEILNYCQEQSLAYIEDESNSDLCYTRNKLRHVLVPVIKNNFNPNIAETILRMSDIIGEEDEFLEEYCETLFLSCFSVEKGRTRFELEWFNPLHLALKRRLMRMVIVKILGEFSCIELVHVDSIIDMLHNSKQGAIFKLPGKIRATKTYGHGIISADLHDLSNRSFEYFLKVPGKTFVYEANVEISAELREKKALVFGTNPVYVDADKISGSLIVRNRKVGDKFKPLGMISEKKLKEFFIDWKVPQEKRDLIPLVEDNDKIVWVAGYQISDDYKVTDKTTRVIELELLSEIITTGEN